ncbi:MAG TPA: hypothetical protein QGI71_10840 [Dehalococcoidia bacterium]|nr:hypothetical protein [Dehalococcoidia bacterium]
MSELDIDGLFEVIDPLLYAVSYDLKSPLLTLLLSADLLLGDAEPVGDGQRIAVQGLTEGSKEMERMSDSLAVLSRAYRKPLDEGTTPLTELLVDCEASPTSTGHASPSMAASCGICWSCCAMSSRTRS